MNRPLRKLSYTSVMATSAALVVLGGGTAAVAMGGGDGGPNAAIAKKSDRRVGAYRGTTEEGGTVSFRITKKRKVVGFTMPNVPLECIIVEQANPNEPTYPVAPVTIKAPPMKLKGVAKFLYEEPLPTDRPFTSTLVDGKPDPSAGGPGNWSTTGLQGNGVWDSSNAPLGQVGSERCTTGFVDWSADKVGKKK